MEFRKVIQAELDRREWSAYRLAKQAGLPVRGVQAYLAGQAECRSDRLAAMCKALGLELRPEGRRKGG